MDQKVEQFYIENESKKEELSVLRALVLECDLEEVYKWRIPVYTWEGKNIVGIGVYGEQAVLSFFKGSLLQDEAGVLVKPGEHSQAGRFVRFAGVDDIRQKEELMQSYIYEAIECERAGLKVAYKSLEEYEQPEELLAEFEKDEDFQHAFESLTPGRQKGYILHFSGAKQSATRTNRILNYKERIMNGYGMRDCVCGLSKRYPNCDGSHKGV